MRRQRHTTYRIAPGANARTLTSPESDTYSNSNTYSDSDSNSNSNSRTAPGQRCAGADHRHPGGAAGGSAAIVPIALLVF